MYSGTGVHMTDAHYSMFRSVRSIPMATSDFRIALADGCRCGWQFDKLEWIERSQLASDIVPIVYIFRCDAIFLVTQSVISLSDQ